MKAMIGAAIAGIGLLFAAGCDYGCTNGLCKSSSMPPPGLKKQVWIDSSPPLFSPGPDSQTNTAAVR